MMDEHLQGLGLTQRERQVVGFMYTALSYKEIAHALGIQESTLRVSMASKIASKLKVSGRIPIMARRIAELEARVRELESQRNEAAAA